MTSQDRFTRTPCGILTVNDTALDGLIRRLALRAAVQGACREEIDATLRCLINHCEAYRTTLFPKSDPSPIFPIEEIKP